MAAPSRPVSAAPPSDPPATHRLEAVALDGLSTAIATMPRGALVLLYGPSGGDCDAVARIAANLFAFERRGAMEDDPSAHPAVAVDAYFDRDGVLDVRTLFASIQAQLGAPPVGVQFPDPGSLAAVGLWMQGRHRQIREHADYFLAAVQACRGRSVEVVIVTGLGHRGERVSAAAPGAGTETLTQFAAAAGVVLVLSGNLEVLDYRTTSTSVAEVHFPRYQPNDESDRAEFGRITRRELARLGADSILRPDALNYLITHTLGSVGTLRAWVDRAMEVAQRLPDDYTAEDLLAYCQPQRLGALRDAARRIVAAEQRLANEARVSVTDVFAILSGASAAAPPAHDEPAQRSSVNYRDPQTRRPGERNPIHDPVGKPDEHVA